MQGITNVEVQGGDISSFLDVLYPVGSVYMSTNSTSPASLLGGSWSQIEGKFLLGVGDTYAANSSGGNSSHTHSTGSHTLTLAETPSHSHTMNSHSHTGSTNWRMIVYNYSATGNTGVGRSKGNTNNGPLLTPDSKNATWYGSDNTASTTPGSSASGSGGGHSHGTSGSSSNLPPYLSVYMWQRIS